MKHKKWTVYVPEFISPIEPQREILEPIAEIKSGLAKDEKELISIASQVDAILVSMNTNVTRSVIEACPKLKIIAKYGVGIENIDIEAATDMRIPVTYNPGVNADAVASLTIGLMLAVIRGIQIGKKYIDSKNVWNDPKFMGDDINGSTIGIIGYGHIAKKTIRKLQGFDAKKILVFTETKKNEKPEYSNVDFVDLQYLLREADIVSIHKSLTPQSRGLIGKKALKTMKNTAYLINTSRGALVQEKALIQALSEGLLAGAALDVLEKEPSDRDNPLIAMDNVVMTPHIGASTRKTRMINVTNTANNISNILQSKKIDLKFVANPEVLS